MTVNGICGKYLRHALAKSIFKEYLRPARKYHNISHISWMLKEIRKVRPWAGKKHVEDELMRPLLLSVVFHDVIYEKFSKFNEENSCKAFLDFAFLWNISLLLDILSAIGKHSGSDQKFNAYASDKTMKESQVLFITPHEARTVVNAILCTKHLGTKSNTSSTANVPSVSHYLSDLDLGILGSPRRRYLKYARDIKAEFSSLPTHSYRCGRTSALRMILSKKFIFSVPKLRRRWEARARKNMLREIKRLSPKNM